MSFIDDFFLNPILSNGWFNPVNTLVYGVILIIAVYLVFRLLKKLDVHIDRRFLYAVLPFIFWGSSTRVLHDAAFYGKLTGPLGDFYSLPVFPTPGSYIITFLFAVLTLLLSLTIQRYLKKPYWKVMAGIGVAACIINLIILPWSDAIPFIAIGGVTLLFYAVFYSLGKIGESRKIKILKDIFSPQNNVIISGHILDAAGTWYAMSFLGYLEQHVLPRFLIDAAGPSIMFSLKLAVIIPVLYVIDKNTEPGDFRNFLKIVVFILGVAPGLRTLVRLMAGV